MEYKKIAGRFTITSDGKFFVGKTQLKKYDKVSLSIKMLENIIEDVRAGVI